MTVSDYFQCHSTSTSMSDVREEIILAIKRSRRLKSYWAVGELLSACERMPDYGFDYGYITHPSFGNSFFFSSGFTPGSINSHNFVISDSALQSWAIYSGNDLEFKNPLMISQDEKWSGGA